MDSQPFRFDVHNTAGKRIGFVVWNCPGNKYRAYRYAGQKPIGSAETLNDARALLFALEKENAAF